MEDTNWTFKYRPKNLDDLYENKYIKNVINQCYHHVDDFRNRLKNFDKQRCYQSAISKKLEI